MADLDFFQSDRDVRRKVCSGNRATEVPLEVPLHEIVSDQHRRLAEMLKHDGEGHEGNEADCGEDDHRPKPADRFPAFVDARHVMHPTQFELLVARGWVALEA
jgi:hypothetical protein